MEDMLLRRRAMMGISSSGGGGLPPGATGYDWLRSDGTQYIDTGIGNGLTTSQVKIEMTGAFFSGTPQWSWFLFAPTASGYVGVQWQTSTRINFYAGTNSNKGQANPTYRRVVSLAPPSFIVTGPASPTVTQTLASTTYTSDFLLLANSGGSRIAVGQIQRTKIWVDGVLVRDYEPCTDPNGRAAAYEHVSGTYNYGANQSGNDFTVE